MKWTHSVVSDSLRPHGLGPTRLLSPWDFLGKSTGVGCHFLLQGIFLTQGSNPGLQHCRQMFYPLSHQGSRTSCSSYLQSKTTESLRSLGDQAGLLNKTTAQSRKVQTHKPAVAQAAQHCPHRSDPVTTGTESQMPRQLQETVTLRFARRSILHTATPRCLTCALSHASREYTALTEPKSHRILAARYSGKFQPQKHRNII